VGTTVLDKTRKTYPVRKRTMSVARREEPKNVTPKY
jgi:hypothetical protein